MLILMMRFCSGVYWSAFVEAHVPITGIVFTLGELGIIADSDLTPAQMANIRWLEFMNAMRHWGAEPMLMSSSDGTPFGDTQLALMPFAELATSLLSVVLQKQLALLISFSPIELTKHIDHPDHRVVGEVVQWVGALADVRYLPQSAHREKLTKRPQLLYWTTNSSLSTHAFKFGKKARERRDEYLLRYYPSQFSEESHAHWRSLFDDLFSGSGKKQYEQYQKIR